MKYLLLILVMVITGCNGSGIFPPFEPEDEHMTYRWPCIYGVTSTARVYGAAYNITFVDDVTEEFSVNGDQSAEFAPGVTFEVNGSTGNDGDWVVQNSVFVGPDTVITVTGDITSAIADGAIKAYTIPAADELRIVFWDTVTNTFVQATIMTDALQNQLVNQQNHIGYSTKGDWGVAHIEAVSNDLEYYQNVGSGKWIADGAWNLLDDDNSIDFSYIDLRTRQNYQWLGIARHGALINDTWYINTSAAVPTLIQNTSLLINSADSFISIELERNLYGVIHFAYTDSGVLLYCPAHPSGSFAIIIPGTTIEDTGSPEYPMIVIDNETRLWCFYTDGNDLLIKTQFNTPNSDLWLIEIVAVYTATALTEYYKVAHNLVDDTLHVILVDTITNANEIIYLRRDRNGWKPPVILQTGGAGEVFSSPQITCDTWSNELMVYYVHDGVLMSTRLLPGSYSGFATPANWETPEIVDDTAVIKHCNAISVMPENI